MYAYQINNNNSNNNSKNLLFFSTHTNKQTRTHVDNAIQKSFREEEEEEEISIHDQMEEKSRIHTIGLSVNVVWRDNKQTYSTRKRSDCGARVHSIARRWIFRKTSCDKHVRE